MEREPEGVIRIGDEEFPIRHPEPPTMVDVNEVRQARARGESIAPGEIPSAVAPGPREELPGVDTEIPSSEGVQLERELPPGLRKIVQLLPERRPPRRLREMTTDERELGRGVYGLIRRGLIGVPLAVWFLLEGATKAIRFVGVHRREEAHTRAWERLLSDPAEASGMRERLIRLSGHVTSKMDLNNQETWEYSFRENAVSLVRAVDQTMQKAGLTWNQLEQRWIEWGMDKRAVNVIKEIWREAKTHNGLVREVFEELLKKTSLLREGSEKVIQAFRLRRIVSPEMLVKISEIIPPDYDPKALQFAIEGMFPKDASEASIAGMTTGFMLTLAMAHLIKDKTPGVKEWASSKMNSLARKVPRLKEFLKP